MDNLPMKTENEKCAKIAPKHLIWTGKNTQNPLIII